MSGMQNHKSLEIVAYEKSMEKEMLKQFKHNVADILGPNDTDAILLKWLRDKNFNLRKSEALFREKKWIWELYKVEHFDEFWQMPEVVKKYAFANPMGIAKDGTPLQYVAMGRGDLKGFVMSMDTINISIYCSYTIEAGLKVCREQSKKLGKDINEITYIIDMEGFHLRQLYFPGVLENAYDLLRLLQEFYPEVWKNVLIVNAPSYCSAIFCLFKPIFRHTLLKDFHVVSRDQTANLLLKFVDADVLPAFLGGNRVDSQGSPLCKEFMKFGGPVPEKYHARNQPLLQPTDVGAHEVLISPRSCHNVPIIIRQAKSILVLEYRTEGGSLPLSILFRKFGSDPKNPDIPSSEEHLDVNDPRCNVERVSPCAHIQGHLAQMKVNFFIPRPGIYILKSDNSGNWLTSRRLIYRFRVQSPDVSPS